MKKMIPLMAAAALMTAMTAQATEATPETAGQMVNPNAQYTYAEEDECLNSLRTLSLTSSDINPTIGNAMVAMLGRLPACEIEKIILAGGNKRAINLIKNRKIELQKGTQ